MTTWNHTRVEAFMNNCFPVHRVLADTSLLSGLIWVDLPTVWAAKSIHILRQLRQFLLFILKSTYLFPTWTGHVQPNHTCHFLQNIKTNPKQISLQQGLSYTNYLKVNSTGVNNWTKMVSLWAVKETYSICFYNHLKMLATPIYISNCNKKYSYASWLGHLFLL